LDNTISLFVRNCLGLTLATSFAVEFN